MEKFADKVRQILNKNGVATSMYFVILLILLNSLLTYRFRQALNENLAKQQKYERIEENKNGIIVNLNTIDMSIRGFMLVRNEAFLDTYISHKPLHKEQFEVLSSLLPEIGFDLAHLEPVREEVEEYYQLMDEVIKLDKEGKQEAALAIIKEDHGTQVWEAHVAFSKVLDPLLASKKAESQNSYDKLLSLSLIFNIILFLIGIPTLLFASFRLKKNAKKREALYKELDENNRELIFDSNEETDLKDEKKVIGGIINNLKRTSSFIKEITTGNFEIGWEGMNEANKERNKDNIAAELLIMRDQMKKKQQEASRQNWVNEGLNKLSEILRDNQDNFQQSADKTLTFLVKYLEAQQGALFVLSDGEEKNSKYLQLSSCYAHNRKKFIEKRVEIGEGILGQAYLEAEPIVMTDIPAGYISITSGLGDATPNCLIIYPLKQNEQVEAIIEIASFSVFDSFAMEFMSAASKTIAASIANSKTNEKTKELLEKSQQQAEEMRAQEEEMRQNMEELEATQEEMSRKEAELRKLLLKKGNAEERTQ